MGTISFDNRVAIVTGAGGGLGRTHALALAARGVKVMVNDLGGTASGEGGSLGPAEQVAQEIRDNGGEALANGTSVTDEEGVAAMVQETMDAWGQVDILVNNAGILRDKTFHKGTLDDFRFVVDVHLMGTAICTKAVWDHMRERGYGRVVMTTSSSGLYGNFGQSNYSSAKMAVIGLMNTLHLEGASKGIRVNAIAPAAATRLMAGLIPDEAQELLTLESVSAALLYLVCDEAPSRMILGAGAGSYAVTRILETQGMALPEAEQTPEGIMANIDAILDQTGADMPETAAAQTMKFATKATQLKG